MRLVLFSATLRCEEVREIHAGMVDEMRRLAEATPGFVVWHDVVPTDSGTSTGAIVFESEAALAAWREHPDHAAIHRRGEESVYDSFRVQIFELVRENVWSDAQGASR